MKNFVIPIDLSDLTHAPTQQQYVVSEVAPVSALKTYLKELRKCITAEGGVLSFPDHFGTIYSILVNFPQIDVQISEEAWCICLKYLVYFSKQMPNFLRQMQAASTDEKIRIRNTFKMLTYSLVKLLDSIDGYCRQQPKAIVRRARTKTEDKSNVFASQFDPQRVQFYSTFQEILGWNPQDLFPSNCLDLEFLTLLSNRCFASMDQARCPGKEHIFDIVKVLVVKHNFALTCGIKCLQSIQNNENACGIINALVDHISVDNDVVLSVILSETLSSTEVLLSGLESNRGAQLKNTFACLAELSTKHFKPFFDYTDKLVCYLSEEPFTVRNHVLTIFTNLICCRFLTGSADADSTKANDNDNDDTPIFSMQQKVQITSDLLYEITQQTMDKNAHVRSKAFGCLFTIAEHGCLLVLDFGRVAKLASKFLLDKSSLVRKNACHLLRIMVSGSPFGSFEKELPLLDDKLKTAKEKLAGLSSQSDNQDENESDDDEAKNKNESAQVKTQKLVVQFLESFKEFTSAIVNEALPVVSCLLRSTLAATDVDEAIKFFVVAIRSGILGNMSFSVTSCLVLQAINATDDNMRKQYEAALQVIYLSVPADIPKNKISVFIASNLISLMVNDIPDFETSDIGVALATLLNRMYEQNLLPPNICTVLWQELLASSRNPSTSNCTSSIWGATGLLDTPAPFCQRKITLACGRLLSCILRADNLPGTFEALNQRLSELSQCFFGTDSVAKCCECCCACPGCERDFSLQLVQLGGLVLTRCLYKPLSVDDSEPPHRIPANHVVFEAISSALEFHLKETLEGAVSNEVNEPCPRKSKSTKRRSSKRRRKDEVVEEEENTSMDIGSTNPVDQTLSLSNWATATSQILQMFFNCSALPETPCVQLLTSISGVISKNSSGNNTIPRIISHCALMELLGSVACLQLKFMDEDVYRELKRRQISSEQNRLNKKRRRSSVKAAASSSKPYGETPASKARQRNEGSPIMSKKSAEQSQINMEEELLGGGAVAGGGDTGEAGVMHPMEDNEADLILQLTEALVQKLDINPTSQKNEDDDDGEDDEKDGGPTLPKMDNGPKLLALAGEVASQVVATYCEQLEVEATDEDSETDLKYLCFFTAIRLLTRCCLLSKAFAMSHIPLIIQAGSIRSTPPEVKAFLLTFYADLAVIYPLLYPAVGHQVHTALADTSVPHLRLTAIMVLSHLVLNGVILIKNQVCQLVVCLVDDNMDVRKASAELINSLAAKDTTLFNLFPDIISHLSTSINAQVAAALREGGVGDEENIDPASAVDQVATGIVFPEATDGTELQASVCNLSEEQKRTVIDKVVCHIRKDKQVEALCERLVQRLASSPENDLSAGRTLAYALCQLPLNPRCLPKLSLSLRSYASKLTDPLVYEYFCTAIQKIRGENSSSSTSVGDDSTAVATPENSSSTDTAINSLDDFARVIKSIATDGYNEDTPFTLAESQAAPDKPIKKTTAGAKSKARPTNRGSDRLTRKSRQPVEPRSGSSRTAAKRAAYRFDSDGEDED